MIFEHKQKLMLDGRIRCIALQSSAADIAAGITKVKFLIKTPQQAGNAMWYRPNEVAGISTDRLKPRGRGC